jgi:hypothetical protein
MTGVPFTPGMKIPLQRLSYNSLSLEGEGRGEGVSARMQTPSGGEEFGVAGQSLDPP